MPFLITALTLVGLLCALDLILTLGVVKRLREHTALLAKVAPPPPAIEVGQKIDEFSATTVAGEAVTADRLDSGTLVAFFSPTCAPCKEKLPKFVSHARALPAGQRTPLAVVIGQAEQADDFLAELTPVARVVVEPDNGPVSRAFGVQAYPTLLRVDRDDAGRLVIGANDVEVGRQVSVAVG
ncbi:TlpA family protein disulfide reductase [Micromonospora sp. CPCC 205558]|uniref:TlpA family protein disulfide reductase n=1 Tax=Micromonospora sp. CPCC 205558 TaxID=3122403 RepID=UPI002FF1941D